MINGSDFERSGGSLMVGGDMSRYSMLEKTLPDILRYAYLFSNVISGWFSPHIGPRRYTLNGKQHNFDR